MITKYQKEQTVVRLKKVYSTLQQATNKAIADNGPVKTWYFENSINGGEKFFTKYFKPYLNIMKNCGVKTTGECVFSISYLNNLTSNTVLSEYVYRFYLDDGTLIGVSTNSNKAEIVVDINGPKKPNKVGRDIFFFQYSTGENKFYSNGETLQRNTLTATGAYCCNKNADVYAGKLCAGLIIKDGWKIADDYPW